MTVTCWKPGRDDLSMPEKAVQVLDAFGVDRNASQRDAERISIELIGHLLAGGQRSENIFARLRSLVRAAEAERLISDQLKIPGRDLAPKSIDEPALDRRPNLPPRWIVREFPADVIPSLLEAKLHVMSQ